MFAISKIYSKFQKTTRNFQRFTEISRDLQLSVFEINEIIFFERVHLIYNH